jgi:hypothetical protein
MAKIRSIWSPWTCPCFCFKAGIASLSDITKEYNLPSEFLFEHLITKRLGSIIEGL